MPPPFRRLVAIASLAIGLATSAFPASARVEEMEGRGGRIRVTAPASGQVFPPGSVPAGGVATGSRRIEAVDVAIRDLRSGRWWHADGTWGERVWRPAVIVGGPAKDVAWSFRWEGAPAGRYLLRARAIQRGGAVVPGGPGRRFSVAKEAASSFLTILFSRTQWTTAPGCREVPGAVSLGAVAAQMSARGLTGTGTVVIDRASSAGSACVGQSRSATWDQIAGLRDRHGWSFVSAGSSYRDMTALPPGEQRREACGSLEALRAHGHTRAWGLFAYPDNRWDPEIQQRVVARCFAFGRRYGPGRTDATDSRAPWFQSTYSVNGGICATPGADCADASVVGTSYAYAPPATVAQALIPAPGRWITVQFYRFVTGTHEGRPSWDCSDPDPARHWTSAPELYCFADLEAILDALPHGATVDPATVARAWGRVP